MRDLLRSQAETGVLVVMVALAVSCASRVRRAGPKARHLSRAEERTGSGLEAEAEREADRSQTIQA